jgi:DNA (cytosine-5)-methyltransferase 1
MDVVPQSRAAQQGLGRHHPETEACHGRVGLLLTTTENGGITAYSGHWTTKAYDVPLDLSDSRRGYCSNKQYLEEDTFMRVAGLFAGIGGIEEGLRLAGHETSLLCEIDPAAIAVLRDQFNIDPIPDVVRDLEAIPREVDLLTAGFPCQDLSQAGQTAGIKGAKSGLIERVFELLHDNPVEWVLLENVSFMLQLAKGDAMRFIVSRFEELGYQWAYRVVDSRAFGLPQRRQRVFLLASRSHNPAEYLFQDRAEHSEPESDEGRACGFYWTEGTRGLGWTVDAVPTLKGGSTIGIPSPPAVLMSDGSLQTPTIEAAERLQGFESGWTEAAQDVGRASLRWKLVGNAVSVPCARWIGEVLNRKPGNSPVPLRQLCQEGFWPQAAFGSRSEGRHQVEAHHWPISTPRKSLESFLNGDVKPLSIKAARGFHQRYVNGGLRKKQRLLKSLEQHLL